MPNDAYFDSGLQGWIKSKARQELWRMSGWYAFDDLVQDGFVCYCKCRDHYTLGPPEPGHQALNTTEPNDKQRRHFMSLVQRTFFNHIMTLASRFALQKESTLSDLVQDDADGELSALEAILPAQAEEVSVFMAVLQAPTEIGEAINKLINDSIEGGQYFRSRLRRQLVTSAPGRYQTTPNGRVWISEEVKSTVRITLGRRALRETTQERLTRIVGGDPGLPQRTLDYILS